MLTYLVLQSRHVETKCETVADVEFAVFHG